jgi:apolipoprotein N-acyltransferase
MISGALMALAFPKASFSALGFFSLLPLFITLFRPGRKISSFFCGILTGFVFYMGTVYWVTLTMENYGGVPRALSLVILILF